MIKINVSICVFVCVSVLFLMKPLRAESQPKRFGTKISLCEDMQIKASFWILDIFYLIFLFFGLLLTIETIFSQKLK